LGTTDADIYGLAKEKAEQPPFAFPETDSDRYHRNRGFHRKLKSPPLKGPEGFIKLDELSLGKHMDEPSVPQEP
jgi:hypothetical protein